jgi:flagellar protein FlgJ
VNAADISGQYALDANALAALKRDARDNPRASLRAAAQQFESVFLDMVLKSMREATPQDGLFESGQTKTYQAMLDQQLAQTLAKRGATGLAAMLERQLGANLPGADPSAVPSSGGMPGEKGAAAVPDSRFALETLRGAGRWVVSGAAGTESGGGANRVGAGTSESTEQIGAAQREFLNRLWPHAQEASRATGVPAHFMLAQAALETGWGKSEIRHTDGRPSFNLFNIKAGRSWSGAAVDALTTEYANGVAQKQTERFRAYGSYAEAFADYANLLRSNPRYAAVVGQRDAAAFARGLQQAGYATDPMYAAKLERIITGAAMRQGLMG